MNEIDYSQRKNKSKNQNVIPQSLDIPRYN